MCDKMVWLALFTEGHAGGAWTSPLLPPGMPYIYISDAISDRVGKNRTKQEIISDCMTSACQLQQLFQQSTSSKSTSN